MPTTWSADLIWWISGVEIPALAGLFWLFWRTRRDVDDGLDECERRIERGLADAREALGAYKLEVAKSYASIALLKEVEARLTGHLIRIEKKLDTFGVFSHD